MKKFKVVVTLLLNAEDEDTEMSIHEGASALIESALANSDIYSQATFELEAKEDNEPPVKLYRVKLLEGHSAREDQNFNGYVGFNTRQFAEACEYTRGIAIKKARQFGGKIEQVILPVNETIKYCRIRKDLQEKRYQIPYTGTKHSGYISGDAEITYKWEEDDFYIWINGEWAKAESIDFEFN